MKKILIVDNNQESLLKLRIMLDEYAHEKHKRFRIHETQSGSEAVMLTQSEQYDLVFIDVDVAEIESAKATQLIREHNPKAIIIVSSDSQDLDLRSRILQCGAEDYIKKPIYTDLFYSRLDNYIDLIKSRKLHLSIHEGHNLFGHDTYGRTISYFIKEHDVLAEFWEYYLLETQETRTLTDSCRRCNVGKSILNSHEASTRLSDAVRAIYDIAVLAFNLNIKPHIWVEESDKNLYFTIEGLSQVNPDRILTILNKIPQLGSYKFDHYKVSVLTPREKVVLSEEIIHNETRICSEHSALSSIASIEKTIEEETVIISATTEYTPIETISEYQTFDYMDEEDLEDIKENLNRLNTLLMIVGSDDIKSEEVHEIAFYLDRIGKSASIYSESYDIARALTMFSYTIKENVDSFILKASSLGLYCKTFGVDLMTWIQMVFHEGAPHINFMDSSIISNAQMLSDMITVSETDLSAIDIDDMFDF